MNWRKLLGAVAPTIGSALGGPAGGIAVKFVADKLMGKPNATESEVAEAIASASPEMLAHLKELDVEFKTEMRRLDIDLVKLGNADRDSARQMFKVNIWPQIILSIIFVIGYFVVMGLLLSARDINIDDRIFGIVSTVIGVLTAAIPTILQFWFGSSEGSKNKSVQMSNIKQDVKG